MKKVRPIASFADLMVLTLIVVLNPLSPIAPYRPHIHPHIPDKVEIRYHQTLSNDSIGYALSNIKNEMEEIQYYLRVHNVTDEGYNMVAQYNTLLTQKYFRLKGRLNHPDNRKADTCLIPARQRPLIAVRMAGGYWKAGHFRMGSLNGKAVVRDYQGRIVSALFQADTVVSAIRIDAQGIYQGQTDCYYQACGQGFMDEWDGCHKEGYWRDDVLHGFAFESSPLHQLRIGEWKKGRYLGEKLKYTTERIYGIDISRHQHEKGRQRYGINWKDLRITSLGTRHQTNGQQFSVSFIYIKSTEGTTVRNNYFTKDYAQAKRHGFHVGAYHFFSLKSAAQAQAYYFVNHTLIRPDDFPPVLDVEPSDKQIEQIGGADVLMQRVRLWMQIVEQRTGKRPILYISQSFVNKHMKNAMDIKQKYNVWIARYSQYKPDVKLVYWQLCPDGRVNGITGPVDINVFNGYQGQFDNFVHTGFHK